MRIVVLGASGVAGRAFVAAAAASAHTLITDRVDILDRAALTSALAGCDAVVNLVTSIPKPGGRGDWAMNDRVRREGTLNLMAACTAARVGLAVVQSVAMLHCVADDRPQTEDDPIEGYGAVQTAAELESLVRAAPLDVRVVRGGLFYGPGTAREAMWIDEVRNPNFRIPGDGRAWVSPVHVADFAAAVRCILEHGAPRQAYIACDDAPLRLRELYAGVAGRAGAPVPDAGGPQRMRSFRVTNARLRALGWVPAHPTLTI